MSYFCIHYYLLHLIFIFYFFISLIFIPVPNILPNIVRSQIWIFQMEDDVNVYSVAHFRCNFRIENMKTLKRFWRQNLHVLIITTDTVTKYTLVQIAEMQLIWYLVSYRSEIICLAALPSALRKIQRGTN